jgi:predicted Zn-dependent peptidase
MSIEVKTLKNGITLITEKMPHSKIVGIDIRIFGAGLIHDPPGKAGLAHLHEHGMFDGTEKYSPIELSQSLERKGGYKNASVSLNETEVYAKTLKGNLVLATDILSEMILHPHLNPEYLEEEKQSIIEEFQEGQSNVRNFAQEQLRSICYPGQSLQFPITGTPQTLSQISVGYAGSENDVQNFREKFFVGANTTISVAGDIDHDEVLELIGQKFKDMSKGQRPEARKVEFNSGHRFKELGHEPQTHINIGFPGPSYEDDDQLVSQLFMNAMLGASGRLHKKLRIEEKGILYSQGYGQEIFPKRDQGGLIIFKAAVNPQKADRYLTVVIEQISDIVETFDQEELESALNQEIFDLRDGHELPIMRADKHTNFWVRHGKAFQRDDFVSELQKITVDDVRQFAERLLLSTPSLSVAGDLSNIMSYDQYLDMLKDKRTGPPPTTTNDPGGPGMM